MTTTSCTTILRSRNLADPGGKNVFSTVLMRFPRILLAEFNTHKMLVRNSASSRAIPVWKLIEYIVNEPFVPRHWGKNQKGMSASEECNELIKDPFTGEMIFREEAWLRSMRSQVKWAQAFDDAGYHKQIVNRLIENFGHVTIVASGMEVIGWSNFLGLRDHAAAEPHIQDLAREVRKCLEREDDIQLLHPGEWHFPFIEVSDWKTIYETTTNENEAIGMAKKLSMARCASTSFKTVEGFDMTLEVATRIHDGLVSSVPLHASPAEHIAQADTWVEAHEGPYGEWRTGRWQNGHEHAMLSGFRQYRKQLPGEVILAA